MVLVTKTNPKKYKRKKKKEKHVVEKKIFGEMNEKKKEMKEIKRKFR